MFCPVCRDEYRPGFTRCEPCDAALVEALDTAVPRSPAPIEAEVAAEEATTNFCGFLTLDEARRARDKVREAKLTAEILIKDAPGTAAGAPAQEEFWLRVRPKDFRAIVGLIGFEPGESEDADAVFGCSACGATVHGSDEACPGCGLRFEE
jgi:rubrerythrin